MKTPQLALRPNCLLTRRPLKLITGPQSIFFYKKPWGDIPEILFEHGYLIERIQLPFQNTNLRKKSLFLQKSKLEHSHVFCDHVTYQQNQELLDSVPNSTITIISEAMRSTQTTDHFVFKPEFKIRSFNYWLHQKWCLVNNCITPNLNETLTDAPTHVWHRLLDHCIQLAELDFNMDS